MRERVAQELSPEMGRMGAEDPTIGRRADAYARTTASFFMSAQFGPTFVSTSIPVSSS
jgi:hypothetical protein